MRKCQKFCSLQVLYILALSVIARSEVTLSWLPEMTHAATIFHSKWQVQSSSVTQSCLTLCDSMDCSTPGLPVHHQPLEFTQTHLYRVGDAIQPSYPLLSPSPPAFNLSQHQGLFQRVSSLHQVVKGLESQATSSFCDDPHPVYGVCFSLNKSTSPVSLSLTEFFLWWDNQNPRTWASVSPDTR